LDVNLNRTFLRSSVLLYWGVVLFSSRISLHAAAPDLWKTHIHPILSQNCFKCHSELKQKAGLDVSSPALILKGGERGPAVVPGKPNDSLLFQFIQPGADPHMPPKDHQLTEEEIATIKRWILTLDASQLQPLSTNKQASWETTEEPWVKPNIPAKAPPANLSAPAIIDFYIRERWKTEKITPSKPCDDPTFVRRVYLDLAGRIPTPSEADSFVKERRSNKREQLIEQLTASPEFARNMAETFEVLLAGNRNGNSDWKQYLRYTFSTNRHWDEVARDLIVARPASKELKGSVYFLYSKKNNPQTMAEAIAPAFLGFQMNCAQCHNHPLAPEIKQKHYWGLVAFLNRSKNADTSDGPAVSESAIGGFVKFANLKKESQEALLTFVNDKTIPEKRPGENEKEDDSADKYREIGQGKRANKVPKFSRREQLAELVTHDNPLLARSFVNRMWTILIGRGLVHPSDRIDSSHPPSHPDLLAWLAHDFETHDYDIRRLVRNICLSETYQLDSKWSGPTKPQPYLFAYGLEKPLRAEVMLRSLLVAVGEQPDSSGDLPGYPALESMFTDRFPEVLPTEFSPNLRQGLFLTNNKKLDELLKPAKGNSAEYLLKQPGPREQVDAAFLRVLGRLPDRQEKRAVLDFVSTRLGSQERSVRELLWALLTSAEFRFNH
jgi:mono/diheme cytochrome c family protein